MKTKIKTVSVRVDDWKMLVALAKKRRQTRTTVFSIAINMLADAESRKQK